MYAEKLIENDMAKHMFQLMITDYGLSITATVDMLNIFFCNSSVISDILQYFDQRVELPQRL